MSAKKNKNIKKTLFDSDKLLFLLKQNFKVKIADKAIKSKFLVALDESASELNGDG